MDTLTPQEEKKIERRSWLIVILIPLVFLCWGFFIFSAVGDKGQPSWDFAVIEDIPGESPYSTHRPRLGFGKGAPLSPQHIPGVTRRTLTPEPPQGEKP